MRAFPDLDVQELRARLGAGRGFAWIKRHASQRDWDAVRALGLPGVAVRTELQRFYPNGPTLSHLIGVTNIDNQGISGLEKWIDDQGLTDLTQAGLSDRQAFEPVQLSIDLRVQYAMRDELLKGMERYRPKAAGGVILNIKTGEVLALVSLPDFDPNNPVEAFAEGRLNRITASAAEMGSTVKTFTTAMAVELGGASLSTMYDASRPIVVGRQQVRDGHSHGRALSLEEVFLFSSNIGSALEARSVGVERHKAFLEKMGLLQRQELELPEIARPVQPRHWSPATSITAAFGHGFATTPFQTAVGIAGILNHGLRIPPTLLRRTEEEARQFATPVVSPKTSGVLRYLYRLNAIRGSGRQANIPGFRVGGKTGTAEKVVNGRYVHDRNFNVFAAALPMDDPAYVVLIILDDPRPTADSLGITAASNAAPLAGDIIRRTALMLGVQPDLKADEASSILANSRP